MAKYYFNTFKFEHDRLYNLENDTRIFWNLACRIAGNCCEAIVESRYEAGVDVGTDVTLGVWATGAEWSEILDCWFTYLELRKDI